MEGSGKILVAFLCKDLTPYGFLKWGVPKQCSEKVLKWEHKVQGYL
jgi:hypothetical protein